jgi:hypothetical protein
LAWARVSKSTVMREYIRSTVVGAMEGRGWVVGLGLADCLLLILNVSSLGQSVSRIRMATQSHYSQLTQHSINQYDSFNALFILLTFRRLPVPPAAHSPPRARADPSRLFRLVNLDTSLNYRFVLD